VAATKPRIDRENDDPRLARAVEIGVVDEIIEPTASRSALARAIAAAPGRRSDHGNIPL
jgi:acetyl-CoA/propionyl-CoA carboxylase carboxyl transferase subunit